MRILIIGINYDPEPIGIGPYTTGTARALAEDGHEVEVLTGKPYYPAWKIEHEWRSPLYHRSKEGGVAITRCPLYVPMNDSGLKRIIHHASFAGALAPVAIRAAFRFKPDLVINIAPSLISTPIARMVAWLSGAKLWLHIQDFEVEAAFATKLLKANSVLGKIAQAFEASQLGAPDRVSTISPQMCAKLVEKGVSEEKIVEFRNWAEIDLIIPLDHVSEFRNRWRITAEHVALYSGNIANKQGVEIIIEAAKLLERRKDIVFVICGDGPSRDRLTKIASDLENVILHDLQPLEELSDLLGLASIHLLPQISGAADLVLPSKLANMLASGRPVVATAALGTGLANEIDGVGVVSAPGRADGLAAGIEALLANKTEYRRLSKAARLRAEERWSRISLLKKFFVELEKLVAPQLISGGDLVLANRSQQSACAVDVNAAGN